MFERHITHLRTDDPGCEPGAATRARLRGVLSPGAARRATLLGTLMGGVLKGALDRGCDTLVYASAYGETLTLAEFLDSFPHPSPTQFQTSIHPSAVQQVMIDRRQAIREFIPLAGGPRLVASALCAALLAPADEVLLCGGEEQGGWMSENRIASPRAFAFALGLARIPGPEGKGRIRLWPSGGRVGTGEGARADPGPAGATGIGSATGVGTGSGMGGDAGAQVLSLSGFFDLLHHRRPFSGALSGAWHMEVAWT